MTPVHFDTKRSFWLLRGFGSLGMAAAAAVMATRGLGTAVGWFGLLGVTFFGVGAVVGLLEGMRRGPRLTLDAQGVNDRTLGVGVIAWSDIAGTSPYAVAKKPFVGLHLREPAKYVARASLLKRMLARLNAGSGMPPFSVNLVGLDADPGQVVNLIACMQRKAGVTAQSGPEAEAGGSDDEPEIVPPFAERVAQRALVLAAVVMRTQLETERATDESRRRQREILRWLDDSGAGAECEPYERRLLEAPVGSVPPQESVNASWDAEGMAVLAWALRRSELPPFDRRCQPTAVAKSLGFGQPPEQSVIVGASLREPAEIAALGARLFTVHWRLRELSLRPKAVNVAEVAARTSLRLSTERLPIVEGDLAIDGVPVARAPEERWRECLSIATERHRAANWLMGFERLYGDVITDT
jgi:hypothetical protein